jgi:hypothetical protein
MQVQQEKGELVTEVATHVWRLLRGHLAAGFLVVLTLAGIGLWQLYKTVTGDIPGT